MKFLNLFLCLFILFVANVNAASVTYYQGDGKGSVSETYGLIPGDPNNVFLYMRNNTVKAYFAFPNIFGTDEYQIAQGSVITSAYLSLTKFSSSGWTAYGTLYEATSSWTEATLTSSNLPTYTTDGSISFNAGYSSRQKRTLNVTSVVQEWSDDPSLNYGWVLNASREAANDTIWVSDDYSDSQYRPTLVINYEAPPPPPPPPVPEPATILLLISGLAGLIKKNKIIFVINKIDGDLWSLSLFSVTFLYL